MSKAPIRVSLLDIFRSSISRVLLMTAVLLSMTADFPNTDDHFFLRKIMINFKMKAEKNQ